MVPSNEYPNCIPTGRARNDVQILVGFSHIDYDIRYIYTLVLDLSVENVSSVNTKYSRRVESVQSLQWRNKEL